MESLHYLGKVYSKLPSEIIGISDRLTAYNFDLIVLTVGSEAENRALEDWKEERGLNGEETAEPKPKPGKYASWSSIPQPR